MSFQINTNVGSIDNFNKSFNDSIKNFNEQIDNASDFNEVFNALTSNEPKNTKGQQELKGSVEMFLEADAINAQKIDNL